MRLIDADKLLEETRKDRDYAEKNGFLDMYYERQVLIDRIESQPIAYDVDKVVEELEKHKDTTDLTTVDEEMIIGFTIYQGEFNEEIDKAIEIVKSGGNNELFIY